MPQQTRAGLLGIHINLPATVPPEVETALAVGAPAPTGLSEQELAVYDALSAYRKKGNASYFVMMTARPQAVGYGLTDSPSRLAAWILLHPGYSQLNYGEDPISHHLETKYWTTSGSAGLQIPRPHPRDCIRRTWTADLPVPLDRRLQRSSCA